MSLDTKYRPRNWGDVLGQAGSIKVLRRFVATGAGFRQSYLFAGPFGSGKTTMGRILARALLCSSPTPDGDPCDKCESCKSLLELGTSLNYTEVDAATHSGVEAMRKLTEEISFANFGGFRRIYLFDEAHQLSKDALDAMLKPLEDNLPGSDDKKMVCIFCTTEPEKMRATILSRCAPAFVIQPVSPEEIAQRLAWVCTQEQIPFDVEMLRLIAEASECHIRDALKAIEGVSMLGAINEANVRTYLHLDLNASYLDILEGLGTDFVAVKSAVNRILERASPVTIYERLVDVIMMAYQAAMGVKVPMFWDAERLKALGMKHGDNLLGFANRLASRPGRPNASMLLCDLGFLHHVGGAFVGDQPVMASMAPVVSPRPVEPSVAQVHVSQPAPQISKTSDVNPAEKLGNLQKENSAFDYEGVRVNSLAVRGNGRTGAWLSYTAKPASLELEPSEFCRLLALRLAELDGDRSGSQRCPDMDRYRVDPTG